MDSKYSWALADIPSAEAVVVALWARGLDGLVDNVAAEKYRRLYVQNVAGQGACVLLRTRANDTDVGVQGLIPRNYAFGEREIAAATLADFVVLPEHRSLGPALHLLKTCVGVSKERFEFVYGTPNRKAQAIIKRAGFRSLGELTRYTRVVRSAGYWRSRLPGWLAAPVALISDITIAALDQARNWAGRKIMWSEPTEFGAKFDEIWRRRRSDLIIGERSSEALIWRYPLSGGSRRWRVSLASDQSNSPIGYVVWSETDRIALINDFFAADAGIGVRSVLQSFFWHVRTFQIERVSLEFFGQQGIVDALLGIGFAKRGQSPIVIIERDGQQPSISAENVYMTGFDRDNDG